MLYNVHDYVSLVIITTVLLFRNHLQRRHWFQVSTVQAITPAAWGSSVIPARRNLTRGLTL